jgi:hypothetical protein
VDLGARRLKGFAERTPVFRFEWRNETAAFHSNMTWRCEPSSASGELVSLRNVQPALHRRPSEPALEPSGNVLE